MITAMPRIAIAMGDFGEAVRIFRDRFGMPVVDFSDRTVPALGAHVGMCVPPGGSNIELMSPADPTKPLSRALQKFLDRRGEGLYALMLEAPDPDAEAVELAGRRLEVLPLMAGAGGRDVHPRSTHGVLVRVYPNDSAATGSGHQSQAPNLSGIAKVVVATSDACRAAAAYAGGFGLTVAPVATDDERGVQVVRCQPPKGGAIELVSVADPSRPFARDITASLSERGEGMFALVLHAAEPQAAAALLAGRGQAMTGTTGLEISVFGTRLIIEPS